MQLITFPKRYHSSKSIHGDRRYLPFCAKKQAKSNKINNFFSLDGFLWIPHVLRHSTEGIFGLRGWILINDTFLETWWVALFMIKISSQNFTNFTAKFDSKVENCWKSAGCTGNSWITLKFQLICWDICNFSEML